MKQVEIKGCFHAVFEGDVESPLWCPFYDSHPRPVCTLVRNADGARGGKLPFGHGFGQDEDDRPDWCKVKSVYVVEEGDSGGFAFGESAKNLMELQKKE